METPITRKDALKLGAAAGVAVSATGLLPRAAKAASVGVGSRPSILLILVDDMPDRLLEVMDTVRTRIMARGPRFVNAYTAIPLCGPNRAAILTGMFPHTSAVKTNSAWTEFSNRGHNPFTFVNALKDSGYETALCGKLMNGHPLGHVPVGWDYFYELSGSATHDATGFDVADNGRVIHHLATANDSELAFEKAKAWIQDRQPATQPFFIQFSPTNPHTPYTPIANHSWDGVPIRDAPSVNEVDVSDKPPKMRKKLQDPALLQRSEEGMREELEDTDRQVAGLVEAAEQITGDSNLLIIFTSDNGFQTGEHRLMNKSWPYQESIEIPLIMRATGRPAQQPTQLVSSVDISATILNFAGVAPPRALDGRSLHEIVMGIQPTSWRKRVVIENPKDRYWEMYREFQPAAGKDFAYIRHLPSTTDPKPGSEFYDLNLTMDPYQLNSKPSMITLDMSDKLDKLTSRTGAELRLVEEEASTTPGGYPASPRVISTVPTAGATGVARSTNLTATFSEKMDPLSINKSTFKLFKVNSDGTQTLITNVTVSLSTDGLVARLNPFGSSTTLLARGTKYKGVITTGAKDEAGNPLDQNSTLSGLQQKAWTFTVSL